MKIFEIISQEQRMKIVEEMSQAIKPSLTFYIMTVLSSLVATYGLLTNRIALIFIGVVISPLFATVFAFSVSMIKGEIFMMKRAIHSATIGVLLAFAVAIVLPLLIPGARITSAVIERVSPNIFDLIIALAVGVGAGYLFTREGVGPYLPGLALAILLVPQISVAGIGLTLRRYDIVGGASLLFFTNLISLILGNSAIFWVRGFIPYWSSEAHEEIKKKLLVTFFILLLLAAPLVFVMVSVINHTAASNKILNVLTHQLNIIENIQIIEYHFDEINDVYDVSVTVRSPQQINYKLVSGIKNALASKLNKNVMLNINVIQFKKIATN